MKALSPKYAVITFLVIAGFYLLVESLRNANPGPFLLLAGLGLLLPLLFGWFR